VEKSDNRIEFDQNQSGIWTFILSLDIQELIDTVDDLLLSCSHRQRLVDNEEQKCGHLSSLWLIVIVDEVLVGTVGTVDEVVVNVRSVELADVNTVVVVDVVVDVYVIVDVIVCDDSDQCRTGGWS